jgi:hypothetical protein
MTTSAFEETTSQELEAECLLKLVQANHPKHKTTTPPTIKIEVRTRYQSLKNNIKAKDTGLSRNRENEDCGAVL